MPTFSEKGLTVIQDRLNKADPQEETILGKVEEILKAAGKPFGEEQRDVATAVLRTAGDSEQPDDERATALAGMFGVVKASDPPADPPAPQVKVTPPKTDAPTLPPELAELAKSDPAMAAVVGQAAKASPDTLPLLTLLVKRDADKQAVIDTLTDDKAHTIAVTKAESFGIPTDQEKLVSLVQKAEKAGLGDELSAVLTAAGQQIKTAALFGEIGSADSTPGSALAELETLAKGLVEKAGDGKLTFEAALLKAGEQHPEIYTRHLAEAGKAVH